MPALRHAYDFLQRPAMSSPARKRSSPRPAGSGRTSSGCASSKGYGATETAPATRGQHPDAFPRRHRRAPAARHRLARLEPVPGVDAGRQAVLVARPERDARLSPCAERAGGASKHRSGRLSTTPATSLISTPSGFVTIAGSRLKRFAKIAGEMVSLAAPRRHLAGAGHGRITPTPLSPCPIARKGEQTRAGHRLPGCSRLRPVRRCP